MVVVAVVFGLAKAVAAEPVVVICVARLGSPPTSPDPRASGSSVMPWLAAWIVWMPFEMPSSRLDRSPERWLKDCEVKNVTGLSRAEETFLPVDRRPCVVAWIAAVSCSERRF